MVKLSSLQHRTVLCSLYPFNCNWDVEIIHSLGYSFNQLKLIFNSNSVSSMGLDAGLKQEVKHMALTFMELPSSRNQTNVTGKLQ